MQQVQCALGLLGLALGVGGTHLLGAPTLPTHHLPALLVQLLVSYLFYKNPSWDFLGDFKKTLPVSSGVAKEGIAEEVAAPAPVVAPKVDL